MRDVIRIIQQSLIESLESAKRRRHDAQDVQPNMGALYEDVEKFFGDIFAYYGRFLARYPVVFIVVSLLVCCLLGMGLVNIRYEQDVETLYTPMGSPAFKDRDRLVRMFPDTTLDAYYPYQLIHAGTYGELMFEARGDDNILDVASITEITRLRDRLLELTLNDDDRGLHYEDVCAVRGGVCVIGGNLVLDAVNEDGCYNRSRGYPFTEDQSGYLVDLRDIIGDITEPDVKDNGDGNDECLRAKVLRMRFNLRHDTPQQRTLSLLWETQFLDTLAKHDSDTMNVTYAASESLDIELANHLGKDTKFFSLTIVIMVLYVTFVSSGGNWVSTRTLLAQAGILAALLAILATFGLLSMCGMLFVDICGVMPFLILGVGVDDMFILMSGWRQTDLTKSIEDRMADTFRSSAISVTITSLTDLLAFCIGATSPFLAVKNFCIYAGVAVFFCYLNHLSFFAGCMVLNAQRVGASRHCVTCLTTKPKKDLEEDLLSRTEILFCHGQPPAKVGEDDSFCEKITNTVLPRLLLQWPVKTLVILLFFVYLGVSIWGASRIKTGLKIEHVVPDSSYLSKHLNTEREYFRHNGPPIMFVVTDPIQYQEAEMRIKVGDILKKARRTGYVNDDFTISWLQQYYESEYVPQTDIDFIEDVKNNFLVKFPQYRSDIKFNREEDLIIASRFYVRSKHLNNSTSEGDMMTTIREIASNSSLPVLAYSPEFIFYEHYVSILKNTLLSVGVAIIGMIFIALMFIPHPISIICVTITMVTIVLGMFGFMYFWDLELSAITNVQIILSVGFCVDFTVHISHAFMTATGKNRNERVVAALEKVGIPILNGAFSSILGVLILAFAHSYVFRSFFKMMLLVITLGLAHSLLLLPVMLSFIGPRRTSKPRVFIPISQNWSTPVNVLGLGGSGGSRRHTGEPPGDEADDAPDTSQGQGQQVTSRDNLNIELMNLESPDENKHLLHTVTEGEEEDGDQLYEAPSTSHRQRTLLDKTPDEEHYRDPVEFTDVQIVVEQAPDHSLSTEEPLERERKASSRDQVKGNKSRDEADQSQDDSGPGKVANGRIDAKSQAKQEIDLDDSNLKESKV